MPNDPLTILQSITGYVQSQQSGPENKPIRMATIDPAYSGSGDPKVTFFGESTLSGKNYPYLASSYTPVADDRVVMIPVGTTYLIVGSIDAAPAGSDTWTSYTPTWRVNAGSYSLGDATLTGAYKQIGKVVFVRVRFVPGSTTTFGTGLFSFDSPVEAETRQSVSCFASDSDLSDRYGGSAVVIPSTTTEGINRMFVGAGGNSGVGYQTPFTWASGDELVITGCYEAV